ncbi:retinol dehydrogenase 3-like [Pelobates cultripes]|uniref:Retinol dehydrogenase 3-like n=1 Tax=Pelobates cultripes TaxID=61616 RepID=A0AAD1R5Q9_PELCU|nr:retinol dehydrogenase 3-like [Pelobates cultripes]
MALAVPVLSPFFVTSNSHSLPRRPIPASSMEISQPTPADYADTIPSLTLHILKAPQMLLQAVAYHHPVSPIMGMSGECRCIVPDGTMVPRRHHEYRYICMQRRGSRLLQQHVVLALMLLYRLHRQSQILDNLSGKYVLITGCDSGFGNILAKQLERRGMLVLAACLTEKGAEDLKKETSHRLQTVILDVTDSQSVSSAAKWVTNIVGEAGLWGLVNNAGFAHTISPNEWQTKEDFAKVLNINLLGMVDVTLNLLRLIRNAQGRIVNVSSAAGRISMFGGGYCISKYGVQAFSDSLRREMRAFGVKVSIIEPGSFRTSVCMFDPMMKSLKSYWEKVPAEIKESYGEQYFQQFKDEVEKITSYSSSQVSKVTDCMEHALTAVYPWTRYSVGWDCKFLYLPASYLPTVLSDYILSLFLPKPAH